MSKAHDFITNLAADGRYDFSSDELRAALGVSAAATKLALNHLQRKGEVANPARGFWVVIPPEYRRLGCLPGEQFVPALMERSGISYYAGLLTAAQFHGAAHQRPQVTQVMVSRSRRAIECGSVQVAFIMRKRASEVPVQGFNTPRGVIRVSSVEATALDLVGYERHAGGLDNVATILSELAEQIDAEKLAAAAATAPLPWSQRLGYLLEFAGASEKLEPLREYVRRNAKNVTPLAPSLPIEDACKSAEWRVLVNAAAEAEA